MSFDDVDAVLGLHVILARLALSERHVANSGCNSGVADVLCDDLSFFRENLVNECLLFDSFATDKISANHCQVARAKTRYVDSFSLKSQQDPVDLLFL